MTRKSLIENKISGKTISLSSKLKVAKKVLPEQTRKQVIEYYLNGPVESFAYDSQRLIPTDFHPFMATLQQAFIDHRPVIITPDQIWLLICQGISNHIHLNTDKLRHLFTSTSKKTHLKIENNFLIKGKKENPWLKVFSEFSGQIKNHIGQDFHDLFTPSFSTSRAVDKAAFEIALMDTVKSYFSYEVTTLCGIPSITVRGKLKDWQDILMRLEKLRQFEIDWWIDKLKPIIENFVDLFQGKIDKSFWRSIYKLMNTSFGEWIRGWSSYFFPYLRDSEGFLGLKNEYMDENPDETVGVTSKSLTSGISEVPFIWNYLGTIYPMHFYAGFMGISQDSESKALSSEIAWAVKDNRVILEDEMLDILLQVKEHKYMCKIFNPAQMNDKKKELESKVNMLAVQNNEYHRQMFEFLKNTVSG